MGITAEITWTRDRYTGGRDIAINGETVAWVCGNGKGNDITAAAIAARKAAAAAYIPAAADANIPRPAFGPAAAKRDFRF